ncbi:DUF6415 family natural product biosynthesis protein [Streptomyces sp. NPDC059740]|uniref:DUF6415 family natural product biosynthesis protein n=1 Tax=Streptomyces sp. NPDC059740 TaxID=3346926 RepID=UPI003669B921
MDHQTPAEPTPPPVGGVGEGARAGDAPGTATRTADAGTLPAGAAVVLAEGQPLPRHEDLAEATRLVCSRLRLLLPETERLAAALPPEDPVRRRVLRCVTEAAARLAADPGPGLVSAMRHAQALARCHHDLGEWRALLAARGDRPAG